MASLLSKLQTLLPDIKFESGTAFYWSPKERTVKYNQASLDQSDGQLALLHESSHAILMHKHYETDLELMLMEVAAWHKATQLAADFDIAVDEDHVQDCLDTYRDWLHKRSTCPRCGVACLQKSTRNYQCHNCNNSWRVSRSRFCRPYRMKEIEVNRV